MWTYTITNKIYNNGQLQVVVNFSNGTVGHDRTFSPNILDDLKIAIQSELDKMAAQDTLAASIPTGTLTDLTPTPSTPLTQQEKDIQAFQQDYYYLQQAQKAIAAQLFPSTNATYQALLSKVQSEFATVVTDVGAAQALTYL